MDKHRPGAQAPTHEEDESVKLPFHPRTLVLSVVERWRIMALFLAAAVVLGLFAGVQMGRKVYQSETVLLYKASTDKDGEGGDTPSLITQMSMVKIQSNLEDTRRRLNMDATVQALGGALDVRVQKETTLMIIRAEWNTAEGAAQLANTLRDVFLDNQRRIRRRQAEQHIRDLNNRLAIVGRQLRESDARLQEFNSRQGLVDPDKEAQGYLDEMVNVSLLLEQARIEEKTLAIQQANMASLVDDVRKKVAEEEVQESSMEGLGNVNIRLGRLRSAIDDDRTYRANAAELAQKELELKRAEKMKADGLMSEVEFLNCVKEYEKQKALTVDTPQIREWKGQIDELDKMVIPKQKGATGSAPLLRDLMLKSFEIQLGSVAIAEKVKHLEGVKQQVQGKLDKLPKLQRDYVAFNREVIMHSEEKKSLEEMLAKQNWLRESDVPEFTVVAEAKPPVRPASSNRRLMTIAVMAAVLFLGLFCTLGLALSDTTLKSGPEAALRLGVPVLGVLPVTRGARFPDPSDVEAVLAERFRPMAWSFRSELGAPGLRVMVASTRAGEGKTLSAAHLAACLGRQGDDVVMVDMQLRRETRVEAMAKREKPPEKAAPDGKEAAPAGKGKRLRRLVGRWTRRTVAWLKFAWQTALPGGGRLRLGEGRLHLDDLPGAGPAPGRNLADFLQKRCDDVAEVLRPTTLEGVRVAVRPPVPPSPDILATPRTRELMESLSRCNTVVIFEAPPVEEYADAQLLAGLCDAVVFVARSRCLRAGAVRQAIRKLAEVPHPPAVYVILNGVERRYLFSG